MRQSYSEETIKQVADAYVSGKKMSEITEMYGVPHGSIHSLLDMAGVARRRGKKAPPEKMSKLWERIEGGNRTFLLLVRHSDPDGERKNHRESGKTFPDVRFLPGNTAGRYATDYQRCDYVHQGKLQRVIP